MPRPCKSYKSSHSTHVERDCGREVGSLFVGISEKKATTYYVGRLYLPSFMFPRNNRDVLELSRGRLYPLFLGNNDISLCKGSKCRDDC